MSDFKKLKVVELRAELSKRSLPQTGKRDELIERLEEYEFHHAEPSEMEVDSSSAQEEKQEAEREQQVQVHEPQSISPIPEPVIEEESKQHVDIDLEEERRKARAIRFGLNPEEVAKVDIAVAIKKLDHALPNRRPRPSWKHRKHHHKVVKN